MNDHEELKKYLISKGVKEEIAASLSTVDPSGNVLSFMKDTYDNGVISAEDINQGQEQDLLEEEQFKSYTEANEKKLLEMDLLDVIAKNESLSYLVEHGVNKKTAVYLFTVDPSKTLLEVAKKGLEGKHFSTDRVNDLAAYAKYKEFYTKEFFSNGAEKMANEFSQVTMQKIKIEEKPFSLDAEKSKLLYPKRDEDTAKKLEENKFEMYWNPTNNTINDCIPVEKCPFDSQYTLFFPVSHRGEVLALSNLEAEVAKTLLKPEEFERYKKTSHEISLSQKCKEANIHYPAEWELATKETLVDHIERNQYAGKNDRFAQPFSQALLERKEEELAPLLREDLGLSADEMNMAIDLLYEKNNVQDIVKSAQYNTLNQAYELLDSSNSEHAAQLVNAKFEAIHEANYEANYEANKETRYLEAALVEMGLLHDENTIDDFLPKEPAAIEKDYDTFISKAASYVAEELVEQQPTLSEDKAKKAFVDYAKTHADEVQTAIKDRIVLDKIPLPGTATKPSKQELDSLSSTTKETIEFIAKHPVLPHSINVKDTVAYTIMKPVQEKIEAHVRSTLKEKPKINFPEPKAHDKSLSR